MPPHAASTRADPLGALPPPLRQLAALGVQRRYRTHAVLIEEGTAGIAIDVRPQRGYAILIGVLARGFAGDQTGSEVVATENVPAGGAAAGGGQGEPGQPGEHRRAADRVGLVGDQTDGRESGTRL